MNLKPTLVAVALTLALPLPALAADCSDWNTEEFFEIATVADIETCLTAGADVNARNGFGYTPLDHAAWLSTNPAMVQTLIDAGADVNAQPLVGNTPLHMEAESGNPAVVQALIDAGADVNDERQPSCPAPTTLLAGGSNRNEGVARLKV